MKKIIASLFCLLFIASFTFAGNGPDTKTYDYKDFTSVGVSSGMKLKVTQSDTYSINVTGDSDDLDDLIVERRDNSVRFRFERSGWFGGHHGTVRIEITMPKLTSLGLSGGSEARIKMDIGSNDFHAGLSGGSELKGNLNCGDISLATSGSSEVTLDGKGGEIKLAGSGGSEYHLRNFAVGSVRAALSGGSDATVSMNGRLSFSGSGGSDIIYYGNAELGSIRASGGSGVSRGH